MQRQCSRTTSIQDTVNCDIFAGLILPIMIATDAKSNEITAVPKLLKMLTLKGAVVNPDALNCRRAAVRSTALNAVQKEGSKGFRGKFKRATWKNDFLTPILEIARNAITLPVCGRNIFSRIRLVLLTVSSRR